MKPITLILLLGLTGCAASGLMRKGGFKLQPPKDASAPSVVNSGEIVAETVIPAGTVKTIVESKGTATEPAKKETRYTFTEETVERSVEKTESATLANPRAPDQTVALAKVAAAERRYLLFIGIGLFVAGIALKSLLPAWGGLANGAFLGAALALAAWKLAEIPAWIFMVAIGVSGLLALGYKRGELDRDGDGIPDFIQKQKTVTAQTTVTQSTPPA